MVETQARRGRIRLSSVVLQELYAGVRSTDAKRLLDELDRGFTARTYVVTPDHTVWALTGQLLNEYGRRHGRVEPRRHIADILILISALQAGAVLVTENVRHFSIWLKLLRRRRAFGIVLGVRRQDHLERR
jgi:predicted nucleic acid-binding protein